MNQIKLNKTAFVLLTLPSIQNCIRVCDLLQSELKNESVAAKYKTQCHDIYPIATYFQPPKMNHTIENSEEKAPVENDVSQTPNNVSPESNDIAHCNSTGDN